MATVEQKEGRAPAPRRLLPAPVLDLRRGVRLGLVGGVATAFVATIGMLQKFAERETIHTLHLGYILLAAIALLFGYLAGKPPPQLEGFEAPRPGGRNVLGGLIAGTLAGAFTAVFLLLVGDINIRGTFPNISPQMVDVLTFGTSVGLGALLLTIGGAIGGAAGGSLHLLPTRWRKAFFAAIMWVIGVGLLQRVVSEALDHSGVRAANDFLFKEFTESLSIGGAVTIFVAAFALHWFLGQRKLAVGERLRRAPRGRRTAVLAVGALIAFGLAAVLPPLLGRQLSQILDLVGIFLIMALGLNIVVGYAGLLDLGYVAFFAVGAYTMGVLTSPISLTIHTELSFWMALPFVLVVAAAAGIIVGTPVLRLRGDYLAIVTLGFGEIVRILFLSDALRDTFGGAQGVRNIPAVSLGGLEFNTPPSFFYILLAFLAVAVYISWALQRSRMGRAWMAIREDESVAEAMGINVVTAKLWAFIVGAVIASIGGALSAAKVHSIFPSGLEIIISLTVLVIVIVGGLASIPGVIVGAMVLIGTPNLLREFEEFRFLIYGGLLIFMMLKRPEGFIPSRRRAQELHEEEASQDAWIQTERAKQAIEPAGGS